jgi:ribonuclease-3
MKIPKFNNQELLATALTHRSALNERVNAVQESNERLEYLGDAVLELVVTEFLYERLPEEPEGKLTAIRSSLVKTTTLSAVGRSLGLGQMLYLSRGEENGGGRDNDTLLADTMEAVIGALYLDQGLACVKKFIQGVILVKFDEVVAGELYRDAKSVLQEEVQAAGFDTPYYQVIDEQGPDHDKHFTVAVVIAGRQFGVGEGKSKQLAQQEAAGFALEKFREQSCDLRREP